ncbi:MAG TPA: hypothetical protein VE826_05225 [Dongiaceae bacterium]|nr:hypothetical protein [Dongiaceae bacterium]
MDIAFALVSFFALVAAWFVLPAAPRTATETTVQQAPAETLAPAA